MKVPRKWKAAVADAAWSNSHDREIDGLRSLGAILDFRRSDLPPGIKATPMIMVYDYKQAIEPGGFHENLRDFSSLTAPDNTPSLRPRIAMRELPMLQRCGFSSPSQPGAGVSARPTSPRPSSKQIPSRRTSTSTPAPPPWGAPGPGPLLAPVASGLRLDEECQGLACHLHGVSPQLRLQRRRQRGLAVHIHGPGRRPSPGVPRR